MKNDNYNMTDVTDINDKIVCYKQKYNNYINKICKTFRIHKDDLETCKLYGLWRFARTFDKNKSNEKTYLTNCIKWECRRFLSKQILNSNLTEDKEDKRLSTNDNFILDSLSHDMRKLIELRYIQKYTIKELASIFSTCKQTIRNRLVRAKLILSKDIGV